MILTKVTDFLKQNKKIMYYLGFFALIYFAMGNSVFAAEGDAMSDTIEIINYAFKLLSILLGVITNFVGLFLNPSWTNGTILGLNVHLKELWILISNIVYFVFAILLVVIAFMNIIGKGDKWELKQALPKFIVGVLIVPFSWFFIQLILSFSSVMTASVLSIPYDVLGKTDIVGNKLKEITICTHHYIEESETTTGSGTTKSLTGTCRTDKDEVALDKIMQGDNAFGILNVYTYGVFALDDAKAVFDKDIASGVKSLTDLGFKTIFNLIIILIFGILVISLGLALFVRGVWLWIYMIFSPLFGLLYFFGKEKDGFADGRFSIIEFFALAFVPVYVAAALSFGLLFIFVAGTGLPSNTDSIIFSVDEGEYEGKKTTEVKLLNTYTISMGGTLANSGTSKLKSMNQIFDGFKGSLGTLIMQLFGLAVLWISVMAAISQSKITKTVVEPIAAFGKSIGDLAMKAPQYTPIFGGMSAQGLSKIGKMPANALETRTANKISPYQSKVNKAFGVSTIDAGVKAELREMWNDGISSAELPKIQAKMRSLAEKHGTDSTEYRDLFKEFNNGLKNGAANNLHMKDGKMFDSSNKFEDEAVMALYDSNTQSGDGRRAISQGYASKVVAAGGTADIVEEGKSGFVDGETYKMLKEGKDKDDKPVTEIVVEGGKKIKIQPNIGGTNMAIGEYGKDGERKLLMTIGDDGIGMDFSNQSKDAFHKDTKKVSDLLGKIEGNDKKQLQGILNKLNEENRVKVFDKVFENLEEYIIDQKDAAGNVMKDADGNVIPETITIKKQLDEFMNS